MLEASFGSGLFALDTEMEITIRRSFFEVQVSQEGGRGLEETSQGRFSRQNR